MAAAACAAGAGQRGAPRIPQSTVMAPRTKPEARPFVRPARAYMASISFSACLAGRSMCAG
eukprot:7965335-Lingulodinium_polyedra.AAC.1